MLQLITPDCYGEFADDLTEMHRMRCRVFRDRMNWDVQVSGELEIDQYDALHPTYLLMRGNDGSVIGCVRLLPTAGPTMLGDTFPMLLGDTAVPSSEDVWESSRFALDIPETAPKGARGLAVGTYELFAGMIEFGLAKRLKEIVTVTDTRMERLLRAAGWPLHRIGIPAQIGNTQAVAGYLEISRQALQRIRTGGGFKGPVLWSPVVPTP
ncbi:MAG TPA: acyl-homoserine-lactone synthase [Terriglobales bacterium]|nr:acyl-homoserine-lactone synthase [Terriglobales bacterium]